MHAPVTRIQVPLSIEKPRYEAVSRKAAALGYRAADYMRMLFDAAYMARCLRDKGETPEDRALDDKVRLVFAMAGSDKAAIASATGFSEETVGRVLDGFRGVACGLGPAFSAQARAGAALAAALKEEAPAPAPYVPEGGGRRGGAGSPCPASFRAGRKGLAMDGSGPRDAAAAVGGGRGDKGDRRRARAALAGCAELCGEASRPLPREA